jgi:hypothetical protein
LKTTAREQFHTGGIETLRVGSTLRPIREVTVGDVVYTSRVRVVRHRGPVREAFLPARKEAVTFGVHSEVAEHYGVDPGDSPPDATTLDYVVAAACG